MRRRWSERWFGWLLRLFPVEFRGDFGAEMAADLRDQEAEAAQKGASLLRLRARTFVDVLRRAPAEHLDVFRRDAGHAWRMFWRRPAFALTVVLTLAGGIGLATAAFAVVSGVLLRDLPVPNSDRIVRLFEVESTEPDELRPTSSANFLEWRERTRTIDGLAISSPSFGTLLSATGEPERVTCLLVTEQFFDVLGVRPIMGRAFTVDEYREGTMLAMAPAGPGVVILSHNLWRTRFGASPDVIGETVRLAGGFGGGSRDLEIVGVMPSGVEEPEIARASVDCWFPGLPNTRSRSRHAQALGRLAPGITAEDAQAEFDVIGLTLAEARPEDNEGWSVRVVRPLDYFLREVRTPLWLLGAGAFCVLVAGALNVVGLLLIQTSGRRMELTTRMALGATRARVTRQLLTEGALFSSIGGLVGVGIAYWIVPVLVRLAPPSVPRLDQVAVDGRAVGFAVLAAIVAGSGSALVACTSFLRSTSTAARSVRFNTRTHNRRLRQVLAMVQVGIAVLLVVTSGLLLRTVQALGSVTLGFDPQNVLIVGADPNLPSISAATTFQRSFAAQVRRLPGVIAAGTGPTPFAGVLGTVVSTTRGNSGEQMEVDPVTTGYMAALRIRPTQGRLFTAADELGVTRVAVVSDAAARHFWPESDPVGRSIFLGRGEEATVIGVAADVRRDGLVGEFQPVVYVLQSQTSNLAITTLMIRTEGDPEALVPSVKAVLQQLDQNVAVTVHGTLQQAVDAELAPRPFLLRLVGLFSVAVLGLTMLGLYGLLAEWVAQRVPEIGVRMALGATRRRVTRLVLSQAVWMVGIGLALGLGAAYLLRDVMANLVYGVPTSDRVTYVAAAAGVALAALIACVLPARRAASVDPVVALREE